jgi:hypothetical protein
MNVFHEITNQYLIVINFDRKKPKERKRLRTKRTRDESIKVDLNVIGFHYME